MQAKECEGILFPGWESWDEESCRRGAMPLRNASGFCIIQKHIANQLPPIPPVLRNEQYKEMCPQSASSTLTLTLSVSMHYRCFSDLWVMNVKEKLLICSSTAAASWVCVKLISTHVFPSLHAAVDVYGFKGYCFFSSLAPVLSLFFSDFSLSCLDSCSTWTEETQEHRWTRAGDALASRWIYSYSFKSLLWFWCVKWQTVFVCYMKKIHAFTLNA